MHSNKVFTARGGNESLLGRERTSVIVWLDEALRAEETSHCGLNPLSSTKVLLNPSFLCEWIKYSISFCQFWIMLTKCSRSNPNNKICMHIFELESVATRCLYSVRLCCSFLFPLYFTGMRSHTGRSVEACRHVIYVCFLSNNGNIFPGLFFFKLCS